MAQEKLVGADRLWGFRFGVDGVVSVREARQLLSIGRTKLYEMFEDRRIRRGRIDRKVVICRRSIREYLATIEA